MISKPSLSGEYYLSLIVEDPDNNLDSTRTFFVVIPDSENVKIAGYADNPEWVKTARIYLMFFKAFTPAGTIQAAIANLPYIKAMGFNTIWVLPVTEVPGNIDNQINIGYNTIDFLKVETSLGTDQDYKNFVDAAHELGIKIIQDITPNHTGRDHPFAQEALLYRDYSQYWSYYQTEFIAHNTNGLGQCVTPQGIYYYCGFSDALLNYDWRDLDAKKYMIDVYNYWVREFGIDGYRFDVYWGVHRKYGENNMGIPVRNSLKHIKPDILLLGEDDGTGVGTEVIYADKNGGLDAAYDFAFYFNAVRDFNFNISGINTLHSRLDNGGFHPGENSYFLRFMESQDEDRISYIYNSFEKTMPMATIVFTAPGMPMMMNGQEVGWGKGLGQPGEPDLNVRRRGIIDWNFGGRDLLTPHYQKIAQIRTQFSAFLSAQAGYKRRWSGKQF
jgi:cyclomaltodextrinase / maltogenic alpha-amylase / neopullulanase